MQQQAREPAPAPDQEEPDVKELLQVFWSPAFLVTILGAVLTSFGILALARRRYAAADSTDRRFEPTPAKPYRPSLAWRGGQVAIGVFIGVVGVAGVVGFGLLAGSHASTLALPLGLALSFVCALGACGGAVVIWNSMRFRLILQGERLEVHRLWGVRVFKLPELASRRFVTLQRVKFLELTFKDVERKPYKMQWVFLSTRGCRHF